MAEKWQIAMERWRTAGLIDAETAERVRAFEARGADRGKLRWPILLAVSFGGMLVAAGVLLFVAAHWDELSPAQRFSLVLLMVGGFHVGGALLAERFPVMATTLHAIGTAALGAGIFLAGQIFNLEEHWPGGVMLWAGGAWLAYAFKRDWAQASFAAILTPAWLASEWTLATERYQDSHEVMIAGLLLLALTYLGARSGDQARAERRALVWLGGLAVIPLTTLSVENWWSPSQSSAPTGLRMIGWGIAMGVPLIAAVWLRGRTAWVMAAWAVWAALGTTFDTSWYRDRGATLAAFAWNELGPYMWAGLGSIALIFWGLREARRERINLGMAGFAMTVLAFYFASVLDKLGRSMSLISAGALFLLGGWMLERARRRLIAKMEGGT